MDLSVTGKLPNYPPISFFPHLSPLRLPLRIPLPPDSEEIILTKLLSVFSLLSDGSRLSREFSKRQTSKILQTTLQLDQRRGA